jgi:hypothetical protein
MTHNAARLEVADIFRRYGAGYRATHRLSPSQFRAMRHIETCRTAALGGHEEACSACGTIKISYNSCRDRHCPKCQTLAKERWLEDRRAELLPCGYFHTVFTLPHALNPLILDNMELLLGLLFATVNDTLRRFATDSRWRLCGRLGFIAVLHTWNQQLLAHFHLHCLVPAGALSFDATRWIAARKNYLFRIESLAKAFRNCYLDHLIKVYDQGKLQLKGDNASNFAIATDFHAFVAKLRKQQWIAYVKAPFAGHEQVLDYLGRYTHRVAISNDRIRSLDDDQVTFTWRDRSQPDEPKRELSLPADEFIRRFLLHVLPSGFMKIRYYGFLAHTQKGKYLPLIRNLMNMPQVEPDNPNRKEGPREMMMRVRGVDIALCPVCGKGRMLLVRMIPRVRINSS